MIKYALVCQSGHPFEAWFGASTDYDDQRERGLVECPLCGTKAVQKQIMAPAVVGGRGRSHALDTSAGMQAIMMEAMSRVRTHVEENFDNVGDAFATEARAIHEGRSEARGIYGEATPGEVRDLVADGVPVAPLPPKPKAHDELN